MPLVRGVVGVCCCVRLVLFLLAGFELCGGCGGAQVALDRVDWVWGECCERCVGLQWEWGDFDFCAIVLDCFDDGA